MRRRLSILTAIALTAAGAILSVPVAANATALSPAPTAAASEASATSKQAVGGENKLPWTVSAAPAPSIAATAEATAVARIECDASFTAVTKLPIEHLFQSGAQIDCTQSMATHIGMKVDYCTSTGGRDNDDCAVIVYLNLGSTQAGIHHVEWATPHCRGTGAAFRPTAINISVNGVDSPDHAGNVQTISCAP